MFYKFRKFNKLNVRTSEPKVTPVFRKIKSTYYVNYEKYFNNESIESRSFPQKENT